jgi:tetratricopeptide (TPR) repeat protein
MSDSDNEKNSKDAKGKFVEQFLEKWQRGSLVKDSPKYGRILKDQEESLKEDPTNPKLWFARGTVLSQMEDYVNAIKCFDMALKLMPNYIEVWNAKADALAVLERHVEAADCYRKAFETASSRVNAKSTDTTIEEDILRGIIEDIDKEDVQIELLNEIHNIDEKLKRNPKDVDAWYVKAVILIELGKHLEAMKCLHEVTKLDIQHPTVWKTKGDLFKKMEDYKKASLCYRRAQEFLDDKIPCPLCGEFVSLQLSICPECGVDFEELKSLEVASKEFKPKQKKKETELIKRELEDTIIEASIKPLQPQEKKPEPVAERPARIVDERGLTSELPKEISTPEIRKGRINGLEKGRGSINGLATAVPNGKINGLVDGKTNGLTNGFTNGFTNGLRSLKIGLTTD